MPNAGAKETDVLVVGAGPAGLIAARTAAREGVDVVVVEEHNEVGFPVHCAGLLSVGGLRDIEVPPDVSFVQNEVSDAVFHSPGGLTFRIRGGERKAYVVDRRAFDKFLAEQATRAGADLRLGFRVDSFILKNREVVGVSGKDGSSLKAKVVIDAEGSSCKLLNKAGLKTPDQVAFLPATQFEIDEVEVDPNCVEVFFGRKLAPGFFAWMIPTRRRSARVGLACRGTNLPQRLHDLVRDRLGTVKTVTKYGGRVYTGPPSPKTYDSGLLVVGDAAGHTKATTGGGVILGGICAKLAGITAADAISKGTTSATFLKTYEKSWKKRLGTEFRTMRLARRMADMLSDKALDETFRLIIEKGLQRLIEECGQIDFQSRLLMRLALDPSALKIVTRMVRDILEA